MSDDRSDRDVRPSPEALLQQAQREGRGRLKVFLGAAPGVGKTYAMLAQARQRRLEGVDIVIGVVETHGRVETEMLTKGLESIPKKRLFYKGRVLAEMDLDAILQRRPKLALVDELAHTNAPGSRHPKRYMDVEEILGAGIDVYTTLNVQHLESLNDVVARITRIRVRETVSDAILDRADEVELVDLTPEDLIQRLGEGKVYVPAQAERAVHNYFKPGNLTALRELALRRTAQRVDEQMVNYMRAHAISGPWEASERVLVLVSERPGAIALVRYARRLADRLRASWAAINIETGHTQRLSETERDRIAEALRVAERLGEWPSACRRKAWPPASSTMRTPTISPISSFRRRGAPGGGNSFAPPPRTRSSAARAISASMSCPRIARQRPRRRNRPITFRLYSVSPTIG
jgi:two-component system sensor histidine kinase KdpD